MQGLVRSGMHKDIGGAREKSVIPEGRGISKVVIAMKCSPR